MAAGRPLNLAWRDLCVVTASTTNARKELLQNISGYAEPGSITAIMGPSGSGKSTLLDALAGRLSMNTSLSGDILLNGHANQRLSYGISAFVTQDDALIGTLTVHEMIRYSAELRLPSSLPREKKKEIIERVIADMGLRECCHTAVGNWHVRGLSGGEKRRLSIALEILTHPRLIFLDEPTSGLDSASAFFVVQTLRRLAMDGRTVIASIHQPSSEVFELFDNLCLLSQGKLVYFGDRVSSTEFFAAAGFPCPVLRNPSDHFLLTINTDFDKVQAAISNSSWNPRDIEDDTREEHGNTSQIVSSLITSFNSSIYGSSLLSKVQELCQTKGELIKSSGYQANLLTQTITLTKRSFKNMNRDLGYYWLRLGVYVFLNVAIGTLYFNIGTDYSAIQARLAFMFYIGAFLTFMAVGGFPSFVEDMKVFQRERLNGHYGVTAFIFGNALSSLFFLFFISLISSAISYNLVKLHSGFEHFIYFVLNLFAALAVVESLMMVIASLVPNFLMGIIVGAGIQGIFMPVAGFFRLPNEMPKVFWKYPLSYIAFHPYSLEGMYENDFFGLEFDQRTPGLPKRSGRSILRDDYQIEVDRSKWWNLAVLFLMVIVYRLLFFVLIKLSEGRSVRKFKRKLN